MKFILVQVLLLVLSFAVHPQAAQQKTSPARASNNCEETKPVEIPDLPLTNVRTLRSGITVERTLLGGSAHHYRLRLFAKHYVNLQIEKRGITLVFNLKDPAGKSLFKGAVEAHENGTDVISLLAEISGPYTLTIEPAFLNAPRGSYRIRVDDSPVVTEQDQRRIRAQAAMVEADRLANLSTLESREAGVKELHKSLEIWKSLNDTAAIIRIYQRLGQTHFWMAKYEPALHYYDQALAICHSRGDVTGEAEILRAKATISILRSDNKEAFENLNQALKVQQGASERWQLGATYLELAKYHQRLGEVIQARRNYELAIQTFHDVGDLRAESATGVSLGLLQVSTGDYQSALETLLPVSKLFHDAGLRYEEAVTMNHLGVAYYHLGRVEKAIDYYTQAQCALHLLGNTQAESAVLTNLGVIFAAQGQTDQALAKFNESIEIKKKLRDSLGESITRYHIARIRLARGEIDIARQDFAEALRITKEIYNVGGEAKVLKGIGDVYAATGNQVQALEYYNQALPLLRKVTDKQGEAQALYALALVRISQGDLLAARQALEEGIKNVEKLRAKVAGSDLRISFLAEYQRFYEVYIDLLIRLRDKYPQDGYEGLALQASERKRARVLLESFVESRANIRQGVDPQLVERGRIAQEKLNAKEEQRLRILSGEHTEAQAQSAERAVSLALDEYRQIEAQIRVSSPRYAALIQPEPIDLKAIQAQLDPATVLLVYSLGDQRSFLFAVTATTVKAHLINGRDEIEREAKRLYERFKVNKLSRALDPDLDEGERLSQMLLGPVAGQLVGKRLVIVADGKLQYVPFAALPVPGTPNERLIEKHEIVNVPSISVLREQRQALGRRVAAPKAVLVIADPVYDSHDSRLKARGARRSHVPRSKNQSQTFRNSANDLPLEPLTRLRFSNDEALGIAKLVRPDQYLELSGFAASRKSLSTTNLEQFRIIHFSAHGILNDKHPELSGIALSLYDRSGRTQDGFLHSHEFYTLNIGAELVVLSACETAVGADFRGEGMLSVARSFMYAGAPRVVVSLWKVDDRATAALMNHFYEAMFSRNMTPAEALQAAQISVASSNSQWSDPYYWAGFVLHGEWH